MPAAWVGLGTAAVSILGSLYDNSKNRQSSKESDAESGRRFDINAGLRREEMGLKREDMAMSEKQRKFKRLMDMISTGTQLQDRSSGMQRLTSLRNSGSN